VLALWKGNFSHKIHIQYIDLSSKNKNQLCH
jgi:hypothetical protein